MLDSKLISESSLEKFLDSYSVSAKAKALFQQQIKSWQLAKQNYSELNSIQKNFFEFDGFSIKIQFNPGRIISSSAKVDTKSIRERKCFLCYNNLPEEQKGILCNNSYMLLVNPFPIFNEHFTIPKIEHTPQRLIPNFFDMLTVAKRLGNIYTVFYNGPNCGASAPDHMHFQAVPQKSMPVENEISVFLEKSELLKDDTEIKVFAVSGYLRNLFYIKSNNMQKLLSEFNKLYKSIQTVMNTEDEPLMNVIVSYAGTWRVFLFPRSAHRPKQFFLEGKDKILLSPAAVDFGGVLITPRKEDFNKITKDDIIDIFNQTTINPTVFQQILQTYKT